jgi:2-iminoacetate synthase ThiH
MKQTAVEWLEELLNKQGFAMVVTNEEINQAKEMEKQQIEKAHIDGGKNQRTSVQYYNETFKSE